MLYREFSYEISPLKLFQAVQHEPHAALLDSAYGLPGLARHSFVAARPFLVFQTMGDGRIRLTDESSDRILTAPPFETLRRLLQEYELPESDSAWGPLIGGAIGFFSYELRCAVEKLPCKNPCDVAMPGACFYFFDTLFVYDHGQKKAFVLSTGMPAPAGAGRSSRAGKRLDEFLAILDRSVKKVPSPTRILRDPVIHSNFSKNEYVHAVGRALEYIREGHIFQVNLSQRFKSTFYIPPFDLYKRPRRATPAPFAAFLNGGGWQMACASPERFLRIRDQEAVTRPIKGTRPRGGDMFKDQMNAVELMESGKDLAELMMIVDLERNDLGRVCEPGTVRALSQPLLESHPTVFHLVSEVTGRLRPGIHAVDCVKACFPGGSVTGAPKIRAMEIIDELETTRREAYTGALGYFSFNGQADLNIVIRTMLLRNGDVYFHAGGGIVADSDPAAEYQESLDKAHALIQAISKSSTLEYALE